MTTPAGGHNNPNDWFPLGPLQAGMLFDELRAGPKAGYNIAQLHLSLREDVDGPQLAAAWQLVVGAQRALHNEFRWQDRPVPEQRSLPTATLPVQFEDWSVLGTEERREALKRFLRDDRAAGFDLCAAPLTRLRIFRVSPELTEAVWTVHHLILDDPGVLLREVLLTYDCLRRGQSPALSGSAREYRDYVEWCSSLDHTKSRAFFNDLLREHTAVTSLPVSEPSSTSNAGNGHLEVVQVVPQALLDALNAFSTRTHVPAVFVIQAAWVLVLGRHSNETDIVFGATRDVRKTALGGSMQDAVGLLTNVLPMRARLEVDQSVSALITQLYEQAESLAEHEHLPLFEIARGGGPRNALFETSFTHHAIDLNTQLLADSGGQRSCMLIEQPIPPLNLAVNGTQQLSIRWLYDNTRLSSASIERLAASLLFTVEQMLTDTQLLVGDLVVLPPDERRKILIDWNQTARPFPENLLIHELFEARVDSQPEAPAVEASGERLSYRALERRANRLAHALRTQGAVPGTLVGVCLERGLDLVVALLAIAKSGAAYLPLDQRYPTSRLSLMLEDSGATLLVTNSKNRSLFSPGATSVAFTVVDPSDEPLLQAFPESRPEPISSARDLCYAIYTSGSTGAPNGVLLSHRAVVNTLDWVTRTFAIGAGDRLLFVNSPCFDLSVYDVFGALGAGATVVVASEQQLADPRQLAAALALQQITVWNSAPATLRALLPFYPEPNNPKTLRLLLLSGDWIPVSMPDAIRVHFPSAQIVSLGGATEAAIWSNWFAIASVNPAWPSIPYGVPLQNCRYHILDSALRPVPIGVAGDLYIGGTCLAEGYLNRPQLTAERFVRDPFTSNTERLYRSGDRALYLENGQMRLLGRKDSQVKVRGFRVELGEVEAALQKLPRVKECLAVSYADSSGERAIRAYVVLERDATLDARGVREQLMLVLPAFAVPSQITLLDALPLLLNGKVDRNALPSKLERQENTEFVAPETFREQRLVALWEEMLQARPIGITDNFFALGGHSLLAVTLVSRINSALNTNIPLERFVARPTIRELLATIPEIQAAADRSGHLHLFNAQGSRPALVLFPGLYGTFFPLRELPRLLGADQPVYLAESLRTLDSDGPSEPTIEHMAKVYEAELLQQRIKGPIILGGYSFGTLIAYELAERLRRKGIAVPLLVSIDGTAPGYPEFLPALPRVAAHIRELVWGDTRNYILDRAVHARRRLLRTLGREYELSPEELWATPEMRRRIKEVWLLNTEAHRRYRPRFTTSNDLLLFRASQAERWIGMRSIDALHGWGNFVQGQISLVTLQGDHATILGTSNLPRIAQAIRDAISAVLLENLSESA